MTNEKIKLNAIMHPYLTTIPLHTNHIFHSRMLKIVKSYADHEAERIALLIAKNTAERMQELQIAKMNLDNAIDTYATAEGDAKAVAERGLVRATICDLLMRERHNGISRDMLCVCGALKSRGHPCNLCQLYREAIYGGNNWLLYGVCTSNLC
jgi:hypothetical protein